MNNKTKLTLSFLVSIACLATSFAAQSADDFIFLKQNVGTTDYELYTYDSVTNVETLKQTFDFKNSISGPLPSGGFLPSLSFVDSYNSKIYLKEGGGNCGGGGSGSRTGFMVYDYKNDTMTSEGGVLAH